MSLIVTGTIGIDTIETASGERREGILGGSCTYFAAAARFFTPTPVRIVAVVGDDFPDDLASRLDALSNIDRAGLERRAGRQTFRWGGRYHDDMDRRDTIFTELGVLAEAPPAVPASFRDASYCFLANLHPAVQGDLLSNVDGPDGAGPRLAVADTMNLWIETARDELVALMRRLDGLVLNFDEAEQFAGVRNPVTAGRRLLQMAPDRLRFVIVKKGEHGALLIHRDGIAALPAYPSEEVVDPTGAGDSFAGGLMGWLTDANPADPASWDTLRHAIAWGTVTASFNIERFGLDRLAEISRRDIDARYVRYSAMTRLG